MFYENQLSTDVRTRNAPILFDRYGFSGSLAWRTASHALVAGADLSNGRYDHEFEPDNTIEQRKYALFVNDTVTAGNFSISPGLRYDHASLSGGWSARASG